MIFPYPWISSNPSEFLCCIVIDWTFTFRKTDAFVGLYSFIVQFEQRKAYGLSLDSVSCWDRMDLGAMAMIL